MSQLANQLQQVLAELKLPASDQQRSQLLDLVAQLDKWNKAYNLTSVRDPRDMMIRHIADSLALVEHLPKGQKYIDVGTGPGLPGLPLAIMMPDCEFVLLDSLGKRIRFIQQTVFALGITNVTAVQSRVEEYQQVNSFDGVLSRAFASLEDMLRWCHHLPKAANSDQGDGKKGHFFAMKGVYPQEEIDKLAAGFKIERVIKLNVPGLAEERHLVDIVSE
ncbi:16S rRNA methyltransferase GidB [Catenovulum agarivorans DS-2]|uniref:Ribosomal RNA small subunit methyltransferase G n=1 Tax=Catenovulum agarivorans DS-2 TaxID=1328313 RepID=W7QJZ2_9ALTE|nr:16S rRNA (guanine(527)-N(7))-methyltransferase RsmG [Catenovulum agarivorans]EWH09282.1 16S rRNA methyltransferase GidB [Catenovulum agarivorans DS-2]